jgi:hypothetical protein
MRAASESQGEANWKADDETRGSELEISEEREAERLAREAAEAAEEEDVPGAPVPEDEAEW